LSFLTDGDEVASLTRRPPPPPFQAKSWYSLLLEGSPYQGQNVVGRIGELGTLAIFLRSVIRLLVTANVCSSQIPTRATRRNIPEDGILHSHRREYLKPYIALTGWAL
jgi:hypothetical protein